MRSLSPHCFGCRPTSASMLALNACWSCVCLKSWLRMTWLAASLRSSITTRRPSRSDSSRRSAMPRIFSARTSSAIFSISADLFTW